MSTQDVLLKIAEQLSKDITVPVIHWVGLLALSSLAAKTLHKLCDPKMTEASEALDRIRQKMNQLSGAYLNHNTPPKDIAEAVINFVNKRTTS